MAGSPNKKMSAPLSGVRTASLLFKSARTRYDSGSVAAEDLADFTKGEFPVDAALQPLCCGQFVGVGIDYIADGKFWRKGWVHEGPLLLFITYNSDTDERTVELEAVNEMLATLKPRTDAA